MSSYDITLRSNGLKRRRTVEKVVAALAVLAAMLAVAALGLVLGSVLVKGASQLDLSFFTQPRPLFGEEGGIADALVGSALMLLLCSIVAIPFAVLVAIYMSEYAGPRAAGFLRIVLDVLNGVPAIVVGIFVFGLLVVGHGQSAIYGAFALAILMVPMVARATQEVLGVIPRSLREASLALGVTRWRTTWSIVLPSAIGGILTGVVIAMARVAGETAPLLFTSSIAANQISTDVTHALPSAAGGDLRLLRVARPAGAGLRVGGCARADRLRPRAERPREDDRGPPAEPARGPLRQAIGGRSAAAAASPSGARGTRSRRSARRGRRRARRPPGSRVSTSISAPTAAAHGIVMIQATRMLPATPQRTAESRRVAPAPMTLPEITCVVETGKPKCAVVQRIDAHAVCAAKPCGGSIFAIRCPSVLMIRQPPA